MKKSYLIIAAVAATLASCTNEVLVEEPIVNQKPIAFGTFTENVTRAENSGENYSWSLSDHHDTFSVWGFKNTSDDLVFDEETVTYGTAWTYTNNRYWDKAATEYTFYACAPENGPFTFNGATDAATMEDGYFTITSAYTTVGENVSPMNDEDPVESWTDAGASDIDLMIAAECKLTSTSLTNAIADKVNLDFIHILSRLNITVKTTDDFYPADTDGDKINVSNITIGHMNNSGTFDESAASGTTLSTGTTTRWTASGDEDFSYDINYDVTQDANYVIETLVMPQQTGIETIALAGDEVTANSETEAYIVITYTISNNAGTASEEFVAYYNLAKAFGKTGTATLDFNEGWVNTLNLTIEPALIVFDADVAPWDENASNDLTVID